MKELASRYSQHLARDLDPLTSVAITVGASQALYLSLQSLISPGDEVVIFEPYFDLYLSQVKLAGGTPVFVPLDFTPFSDPSGRGGEWTMNPERLKAAVGPRTRCVILNSPHNPTGKVFTRGEMQVRRGGVASDEESKKMLLLLLLFCGRSGQNLGLSGGDPPPVKPFARGPQSSLAHVQIGVGSRLAPTTSLFYARFVR